MWGEVAGTEKAETWRSPGGWLAKGKKGPSLPLLLPDTEPHLGACSPSQGTQKPAKGHQLFCVLTTS